MAKTEKKSSPGTPFTNTDGHAAFLHFLPLAETRVAEGKLARAARDVSLVRVNVERGVAAVLNRKDAIQAKLPHADFAAFQEIPALAAALDYAAGRVPIEMSDGEIAAQLSELRPLRKVTLAQLDVFATLGVVPADRVAAIRAGSGPLDTARDAVSIAGLFSEFSAAVANKHPFSADQLATLSRVGNALVNVLTPSAAKDAPTAVGTEAALRDAFYAEVLERYETLREAAVAGYGLKDLDLHVPTAHSRAAAPKKTKGSETPA